MNKELIIMIHIDESGNTLIYFNSEKYKYMSKYYRVDSEELTNTYTICDMYTSKKSRFFSKNYNFIDKPLFLNDKVKITPLNMKFLCYYNKLNYFPAYVRDITENIGSINPNLFMYGYNKQLNNTINVIIDKCLHKFDK